MLSLVFIAALAGSAAAAPRPTVERSSITLGNWTVRADWSSCKNFNAYEPVLQGVIAAPGTTVHPGLVEFTVPAGDFTGSLVLKPAGSVGFGSPVPPAMVDVEVFAKARHSDGTVGVATYQPAHEGATTLPALVNVAWYTNQNQSDVVPPASMIQYGDLQLNKSSSAATTVDPSHLRVYYC